LEGNPIIKKALPIKKALKIREFGNNNGLSFPGMAFKEAP